MPADRLTHPRIGRSRKVTTLTDFEYRVWDTYKWAADDFGVMPKSAAKLRGENDALRDQHTEEEVAAALQRLIDVDLIVEFDHQGAPFVCSLTWNEHQKIEYPRQTHLPVPPPELLQLIEVSTRRLFRNFRGKSRKLPDIRKQSRKPAASRARHARETANGLRLLPRTLPGPLPRPLPGSLPGPLSGPLPGPLPGTRYSRRLPHCNARRSI